MKTAFDKLTQKFVNGLDSAKSKAAVDGTELTPEEAAKAAMKRAIGAKKVKGRKKKKGRGLRSQAAARFSCSVRYGYASGCRKGIERDRRREQRT